MCQFSHVKEKKKRKRTGKKRNTLFSMIWHLRKKKGKLLSGMYYSTYPLIRTCI